MENGTREREREREGGTHARTHSRTHAQRLERDILEFARSGWCVLAPVVMNRCACVVNHPFYVLWQFACAKEEALGRRSMSVLVS